MAPAERTGVAAEESRRLDLGLLHARGPLGVGGDVQRVGRAVDLAQEAGLAVVLAGDGRRGVGPRVEHVGRADPDADLAGDAAARRDDLDHGAAVIVAPSARTTRTVSRPVAWSEQAKPGSAPGASRRRCIPRLSARASALP